MLEKLLSLFIGGGGVAGAITGTVKSVGVVALAPIAWKFIEGHGQDVLFTVSVNQLGAAVLVGLLIVQVAHRGEP